MHATISPPWYVGESQEIEVNYRMQETVSDNSLKSLSPAQRRCRFENEPVTKQIKYYSSSICYTLCRYNLVMKLCGCRPFFYHNLGIQKLTIDSKLTLELELILHSIIFFSFFMQSYNIVTHSPRKLL